jgi:hypothetical protein
MALAADHGVEGVGEPSDLLPPTGEDLVRPGQIGQIVALQEITRRHPLARLEQRQGLQQVVGPGHQVAFGHSLEERERALRTLVEQGRGSGEIEDARVGRVSLHGGLGEVEECGSSVRIVEGSGDPLDPCLRGVRSDRERVALGREFCHDHSGSAAASRGGESTGG